jgi:hypothetical protein
MTMEVGSRPLLGQSPIIERIRIEKSVTKLYFLKQDNQIGRPTETDRAGIPNLGPNDRQ